MRGGRECGGRNCGKHDRGHGKHGRGHRKHDRGRGNYDNDRWNDPGAESVDHGPDESCDRRREVVVAFGFGDAWHGECNDLCEADKKGQP